MQCFRYTDVAVDSQFVSSNRHVGQANPVSFSALRQGL